MHKININMNNLKVTNYDINARPFEFCIDMDNIDNIHKEISVETKTQKTDIFGNKLYYIKTNDKYIEINEDQANGYNSYPIFNVNNITKDVKLIDFPNEFNLDDIIKFKNEEILKNNTDFDYCKIYEINLHKLVDFHYVDNKSDIGFKIIKIDPFGKVKLNFQIDNKDIRKVKFLFNGDISMTYSINNGEYLDYNDNIVFDSEINTIDIIISNNQDYEITYNNVCMLMK